MMLSEETSAVRPQKQTRFNGAKLGTDNGTGCRSRAEFV